MAEKKEDNDTLDGCEIDFEKHAIADNLIELYALFPSGRASKKKAAKWKELFGG
jgi:hypothetical protein